MKHDRDAAELLKRLLEHFSYQEDPSNWRAHGYAWKYREEYGLEDVDPELNKAIREWATEDVWT